MVTPDNFDLHNLIYFSIQIAYFVFIIEIDICTILVIAISAILTDAQSVEIRAKHLNCLNHWPYRDG